MRWSWSIVVAVLAGCEAAPPPLTFDPCQPLRVHVAEPTAARVASVDDALAMWQALGVTGPVRSDAADGAAIDVVFRDAASTFHGYYDGGDATIYVNVDLVDPVERAITVAHELGHALGLVHVEPAVRASVMNPGNLSLPPDDGDRIALDAIWSPCMR